MAIKNELFSRIQLKYDSYENWTNESVPNQGANLVLNPGEMGICYIPTNYSENQVEGTEPPQILFKVGDGKSTFKALPWASAKAADVYDWAKKSESEFTAWVKGLIDVGDINLAGYATEKYADQVGTNAIAAAKEYADGLADNYATAAQGALADSALQKANITSGSANGTIAVKGTDVAVTGLGDAAYTTVSVLNATAKGYADDAQAAAATDAQTKATEALDDAKSYTDGEIDKVEESIADVIDGTTPVAKATDADKLGGVAAADYATKKYVDDADDAVLQDAKDYADAVKADILTGGAEGTLKDTYDTLLEIQTWIEGDGVNTTELTEAIATETQNRKDADKAIQDQIDALGITDGKVANAATADVANSLADSAKAEVKEVKVDSATNADKLGNIAAEDYLQKSQAPGYDDILTKTVAATTYEAIGAEERANAYADSLADNYATAAQGAKADTAIQSVTTGIGLYDSAGNTTEYTYTGRGVGKVEVDIGANELPAHVSIAVTIDGNTYHNVTVDDTNIDTGIVIFNVPNYFPEGSTGTAKIQFKDVKAQINLDLDYLNKTYASSAQGAKADTALQEIVGGNGINVSLGGEEYTVDYESRGVAGIWIKYFESNPIPEDYDSIAVTIDGVTYYDCTINTHSGFMLNKPINLGFGVTGTATVKFISNKATVSLDPEYIASLENKITTNAQTYADSLVETNENNYFVINCGSSTTVI